MCNGAITTQLRVGEEDKVRGFWLVCVGSVVKSAIFKCVTCRKLRGRIEGQMMAYLPKYRCEEAPSFTYRAVDIFEPFTVRIKRSNMKCYGAHSLEVTHSLDTDSFI